MLPRGFRHAPPYRRLLTLVGDNDQRATHLFITFWVDLAYQAEHYGKPGFFAHQEVESFTKAGGAIELLLESNMLKPAGDDYFCGWFAKVNREMDPDYIDRRIRNTVNRKYDEGRIRALKGSENLMNSLPEDAWLSDTGKHSPQDMNRAVVLIRTLDTITDRDVRTLEQFSVELVKEALYVCSLHPASKLEFILKRIYANKHDVVGKQQRKPPVLSNITEKLLADFSTVVLQVWPDEGWYMWEKKFDEEGNS